METLLQIGDVFTSSKLGDMLYGEVAREPNGSWSLDCKTNSPYVTYYNLHTQSYDCPTSVFWKETKDDGWYRDRQITLSTKVKDPKLINATWRVIQVSFGGGGTGHGQYDIYPNGHYVVCRRVDSLESLSFYQSGCFTGMLLPEDIVKVDGE